MRNWRSLSIGGLSLGSVYPGGLHLAAWHNPRHQCWLWLLDLRMCRADERRSVRVLQLPGGQARHILQLWSLNIEFVWQAEGWFRNSTEYRQHQLAKQLGVKL